MDIQTASPGGIVRSAATLWTKYQSVLCLGTDPQPIAKPVLHRARSSPSSFNFHHPLFFLRSFRTYVRLLRLLLVTSLIPSIFLSGRSYSRFEQLAFLLFIVYSIFLSYFTLHNTSPFLTQSIQLIFSIHRQHHISEFSRYFWSAFRTVQTSVP